MENTLQTLFQSNKVITTIIFVIIIIFMLSAVLQETFFEHELI